MTKAISMVWNTHKNNISKGFTHLQNNEEFVDMTLATDGYLVKVHKNIIAVASPYLKEILKSITCSHPVLFFNDITYDILCLLLEYIYTGEALVPEDKVTSFVNVAKKLHIYGFSSSLPTSSTNNTQPNLSHNKPETKVTHSKNEILRNFNAKAPPENAQNSLSDDLAPFLIPKSTKADPQIDFSQPEIQILYNQEPHPQHESYSIPSNSTDYVLDTQSYQLASSNSQPLNLDVQPMDCTELNIAAPLTQPTTSSGNTLNVESIERVELNDVNVITSENSIVKKPVLDSKSQNQQKTTNIPKYTLSKRGKLILILNRFMYNIVPSAKINPSRRYWKCVDYRPCKCLATVITEGEAVVTRKNPHSHSFHDDLIEEKAKRNIFFTSVTQAAFASKEEEEIQRRAQSNRLECT